MKIFLAALYKEAVQLNEKNLLALLEKNPDHRLLDLGCDDGQLTLKLGKQIKTSKLYGVEISLKSITQAQANGIEIKNFDLNHDFDWPDNYFDVIHANQVIEHLVESDNFLSEIYRVLKPGGYALISTENASSWCNIFASLLGWQIFSLTNISDKKLGVGNPFALHKNDKLDLKSWRHVRIYNFYGLKDYLELFNFKIERIKGAGYFPLPAILGDWDKIHCHFMTFKLRKEILCTK
ncbi:MAG: class I SAM-dependent methyltransferase [Candidatus Parcubacteria bacterium]|nr:class I SAM-dependent methyltransferase [Candidatus Parcubacteria bacterium]